MPTIKKRHFIEQIKALIFLEAVLKIKAMSEPHSNLQEIDIPNIIKDNFHKEKTHPYSHQ